MSAEGQLAHVVSALVLAADLALGQPLDHGLRAAAVAMRFAEELGLSDDDGDRRLRNS